MTYSFRARCKLYEDNFIESTSRSLELLSDGVVRIELLAFPDERTLRDSDSLVLKGSGFADIVSAREGLKVWTARVKAGLAGAAFAVDFFSRTGRSGFTNIALAELESATGTRVKNDSGIPAIYRSEPPPLFVGAGPFLAFKGIPAQRILNQIQHATNSEHDIDDSLHLAYDLYSSAFGLRSPDARFVMLVTAIEALIRPAKRSDTVQSLVDDFEQAVREAEIKDSERQSLLTTLGFQRMESISQSGRKLLSTLTEEFYGESPSRFFSKCYGIRSSIVHGSSPRPNLDEVQQRSARLEFAVGHLISTIATGTEYVSP